MGCVARVEEMSSLRNQIADRFKRAQSRPYDSTERAGASGQGDQARVLSKYSTCSQQNHLIPPSD